MIRSFWWGLPVAAVLAGCGGPNPCDLLTVEAAFVALEEQGYSCTDSAPCEGEIWIELTYEDATEPTMLVVIPISVGTARTQTVSQSVHKALLGERDSFPNREVTLMLEVPGDGTLTYAPMDLDQGDVTLVDDPLYEGCDVQDEEKLVLTFDATSATLTPDGAADTN